MPKEKIYLFDHSPHLREEWDYEKNAGVDPEIITFGSDKKTWWVCPKGHTYNSAVKDRGRGRGCPYCSNRLVDAGVNDLKTLKPHLAVEWDYTKNKESLPEHTALYSNKKVWWLCSKGHNWYVSPSQRVFGYGCSFCSGRYVVVGETDIATTHPELAQELANPSDAYLVSKGSHKSLLWRCPKEHEYSAPVSSRINMNSGCPYCTNQKVLAGYNDLLTLNPAVCALLLDKTLATKLTVSSGKKVDWMCSLGHIWSTTVASVSVIGTRCPVCSNQKVLVGFNDLETTHPALSLELRYPEDANKLTFASNRKPEWVCGRGHIWAASVNNRSSGKGRGCPVCSGRAVRAGSNDLKTVRPEIAKEWDYDKNIKRPEEITEHHNGKAWWLCPKGHSYHSTVNNRTTGNRGCARCSLVATSKSEGRLRDLLGEKYNVVSPDHTYRLPVAYRKNKSMSVDIYMEVPHKCVVEYDGCYWHSFKTSMENDKEKTRTLLENGYLVVRVREQSAGLSLPLLDIDHPNLLQIMVEYLDTNEELIPAVEKIKSWLEEKNA